MPLLERDRFGGVDTGRTSAHLTYVTDLRLHQMVKRFGPSHAQAAWDAGRAAINVIDDNIREEEIDCDFAWVPGYLHAPRDDSSRSLGKQLRQDVQLAAEFGLEACYLDSVPFMGTAGVRFANQATGFIRSNIWRACWNTFPGQNATFSKAPR